MDDKSKNATKWGRTTRVDSDTELEQILQVETIGAKPKPTYILLPYGYSANIPEDSTVIMVSPGGSGQDQAGIPTRTEDRFRGLKEWEVKVGNFKTKSNTHYDEDGNIRLNPTSTQSEDWAIQFTEMKAAFDQLKSDFDALVLSHNNLLIDVNAQTVFTAAHTHSGGAIPLPDNAGSMIPSTSTGSNTTADMTDAKVDKVRLP